MIDILDITEVNFYGDPIAVVTAADGTSHVSVAQILGNLGIEASNSLMEDLMDDPRLPMGNADGQAVVTLDVLNGLLYLIRPGDVSEPFRNDLLRYQLECTKALRDYWIAGAAVNRRETPSQFKSPFRDERAFSREVLTKACAAYCRGKEELDPHDIFDRALTTCYAVTGIEALAEDQELSGSEAKYLAWVETIYAKVLSHYAQWNKVAENIDEEARAHVSTHLRQIGSNWMRMADNVPTSLYS